MALVKLPLVAGHPSPDVAEYLAHRVPEGLARLLPGTRAWVWQHVPYVAEGIRWGVVYFHHQGPLLYLDVDKRRPGTLRLAWARGTELEGAPQLLRAEGANGEPLKMIRVSLVTDLAQLDAHELVELLHQAVLLNEAKPIGPFWGNRRRSPPKA